jgi:hypothetical protein
LEEEKMEIHELCHGGGGESYVGKIFGEGYTRSSSPQERL